MGQTLSHGVYLPNEGERNCYAGLASNWQILNTAVGNIAEKAPLVHTHGNITNDGKVGTTANLPLITGTGGAITAGAFGNQANTFCEGNDSRLSDARTPVAHTHTKSDVTDLFNSANTWTGENKYTSGFILSNISWSGVTPPSSTKPTVIEFKNSDTRQGRYINRISSTSSETWIETIRNVDANTSYNHTVVFQVDNSGNKSVYPYSNNDIDLGIAAHQWNNLYAKKVNTQSVNGINPGALSLPGAYQAINDQIKDPNGQLNAFDLNGGSNTWVSDVDCYLYFYIPNNKFTWIRIFWPPTLVRCGQTFVPVPNESSDYSGFVPVPANTTVVIQVKGTQAPVFRRSACLGNV